MQTPDAIKNSIIDYAPKFLRPYLQLSRFDRPIGFWLLALPCFMGHLLGLINIGFSIYDLKLGIIWIIGAISMRGAGCTINDIFDKDFDKKVERTKNRPIASGVIGVKSALLWLVLQLIIGASLLWFLPSKAQIMALCALPLIFIYPLMKRITWWPQLFLGIVFNSGVLVGYLSVNPTLTLPAIIFWIGTIFWTLGYDTIYAMNDIDDDALIGVKSSARKLGANTPNAIFYFYSFALIFISFAIMLQAHDIFALIIYLPFLYLIGKHFNAQYLKIKNGENDYTNIFRSNKQAGILIITALICVVLLGVIINQIIL